MTIQRFSVNENILYKYRAKLIIIRNRLKFDNYDNATIVVSQKLFARSSLAIAANVPEAWESNRTLTCRENSK